MHRNTRAATLALALILGASCWSFPYFQSSSNNNQQKQSDKDKKKQPDKDKNKKTENKDNEPIFGGNITLKSSRKTSDSTTMGFSGLTPNGEVEASKLKEPITADDLNKAAQVSSISVKTASSK